MFGFELKFNSKLVVTKDFMYEKHSLKHWIWGGGEVTRPLLCLLYHMFRVTVDILNCNSLKHKSEIIPSLEKNIIFVLKKNIARSRIQKYNKTVLFLPPTHSKLRGVTCTETKCCIFSPSDKYIMEPTYSHYVAFTVAKIMWC